MSIKTYPKLASHDIFALLIIAAWTLFIIFLNILPRGQLFLFAAEAIAKVYPALNELIGRFGGLSYVVYCYVLWLPIAPIFFILVYQSKSINEGISKVGPSVPRLIGLVAIIAGFIFFYPPDPPSTNRGVRTANLLFNGKFSTAITSGLLTYTIVSLLAYATRLAESIVRSNRAPNY